MLSKRWLNIDLSHKVAKKITVKIAKNVNFPFSTYDLQKYRSVLSLSTQHGGVVASEPLVVRTSV